MAADESSARDGRDRAEHARNGYDRTRPVGPDEGPDSPTELPGAGWVATLKRTVREFQDDSLTDWAAALTYYGVLSIFPGLLVLISVLGLLGERATQGVKDTVDQAVPQPNIQQIIDAAIEQAGRSGGLASIAAIIGLLAAFWSASGYVGAFMRASNSIYDVPEGRPIWKTLPIRLGVTAVIGVMLLASAVIVVFTGGLAEKAGNAIGLGSTAVTVWNIAKWPVLLVLVSLMFAILYWASPNARHGGFRWVSPGGVLAVVIWLVISGLFALYVGNFGSYNKTYGALAGVIIFLIWLWLSNIAILLGAEFDAELERSRAIQAGHPADKEPYVELRDDRKLKKKHNATRR
ncbi:MULTISPECIES: YihY/virulence factor BrkB family protein [Micromonospora]|uniref:YihY/virulence factor BrkB family protein n=1 Tax=Micromonospora solifontis TaxID=2487138 RepID=A0ABX9WC56_9ACTN|nr:MULTISPECIES: YihY/virulence factor BrkB family protein [Micromonospora]NES16590.1 YihY/virulence factor BrkB family protein [Micromonospora sp. PPF5-17B]NES38380.1 YihY/virulence factor BrkB family protein [Micromonospora solifontis]NES58369.1 YihY/virulence factor BrkB family protein [Micromonospora sp. PPF5-6]RNL95852.1 YihY/virulence factor BrkB family protein [Micromonospora solifontis]